MRLCCADWFVPGDTYTDKCRFLQEVGISGIEMFLDDSQDLDAIAEEAKRAQEDTGVAVSTATVLGEPFYKTVTNNNMVEDKVALTKKSVDLAKSLGSDFTMVVPEYAAQTVRPFVPMGTPSKEEEHYFVTFLQKIADYAQQEGMMILVEPINRYENHFYHTVADAAAVCKKTGKKNVKTFIDFFHAALEEGDIAETICTYKDDLFHVHLSDNNRRFPGKGHTDLASGFKALREIGYDRNVTLEVPIEFVTDPKAQLIEYREYMTRLWDSV